MINQEYYEVIINQLADWVEQLELECCELKKENERLLSEFVNYKLEIINNMYVKNGKIVAELKI